MKEIHITYEDANHILRHWNIMSRKSTWPDVLKSYRVCWRAIRIIRKGPTTSSSYLCEIEFDTTRRPLSDTRIGQMNIIITHQKPNKTSGLLLFYDPLNSVGVSLIVMKLFVWKTRVNGNLSCISQNEFV